MKGTTYLHDEDKWLSEHIVYPLNISMLRDPSLCHVMYLSHISLNAEPMSSQENSCSFLSTPEDKLSTLFCYAGSVTNTESAPQNEINDIVSELNESGCKNEENYLKWGDVNNDTVLEIAIKAGNTRMVETLLEKGNTEPSEAFKISCKQGHLDIVDFLLKINAHESMDFCTKTWCISVCAEHGFRPLLEKLLIAGFPLYRDGEYTYLRPPRASNFFPFWARQTDGSLLHVAAGNGHHQTMVYLMQQGMEIESGDSLGRTPLHLAVQGGVTCLRRLLQANAEIDAKDNNGHTALFLASSFGDFLAVKHLMENGAEVDTMNDEGVSALVAAASSNHDNIVKYLLDQGASFQGTFSERVKSDKLVPQISESKRIRESCLQTLKNLEECGNILPAARIKLHIGIGPELIMYQASQKGHMDVAKLLIELDTLETKVMRLLERSGLKEHADIVMDYAFPKRLTPTMLIRGLSTHSTTSIEYNYSSSSSVFTLLQTPKKVD